MTNQDQEQDVSPAEQEAFNMKWDGRFEQLAGKAKTMWGNVSDDDVQKAEGSTMKLVGYLKEKTGESSEAIIRKLNKD